MDPVIGDLTAGGRRTRAAVWTGTGVDLREVALPDLDIGELLVRVDLATVCGSDLHTVSGRRPAPCPSVLGHEAVGRVVGSGQRVVWGVTVACGRCDRCESGRTAKCRNVRKVGHERYDGAWPLSGGYAQHIVLPAGSCVVPVPEIVPDTVAAPAACATATVMAALEQAGDLDGRRVLICGAGMLGVTATAACAVAGARVWVTDPDPVRLGIAERFGGRPDDGAAVDTAIDFSGSSVAVARCLDRLDVGGVLVLAGSVTPGPAVPLDPEAVVRRWLTVTGVHNYEPRHLEQAVRFLAETVGIYPWDEVVGEPVGLDGLAEALVPPAAGLLRAAVAP